MKVPIGVYAMLFIQTMAALGSMILLPTMPFYAMTLGADAFSIAMLGSACNCAQMLCSPALGVLSDRVGRKLVMLAGLSCQFACNLAMGQTATLSSLLMVRVMAGMALSTGPVEMAYIMDNISSESDLSHVLTLQRVMTSAGALIGPLAATSLGNSSFQTLCQGLAGINMANLLVGAVLWRDMPRKDVAAEHEEVQECCVPPFLMTLRSMFLNRATASLLLVSWIYTLGFGIGDGPEVLFLKEHFDFGKREVCYFFVVTNLSSMLCASVVPQLIDAFGARNVCKAGCLGAAGSLLLFIVGAGRPSIPYVCGTLEVGLFGSMIGLSFMHLVRQSCPESLMGTMLGLQSCLNGFAGTIGPPAGGLLYQWNPFLPIVCSALFAAMAAGLYSAFPTVRPEEVRLLRPALPFRPRLARVSSFGQPIYPNKSFLCQVNAHVLRLQTDPELLSLYKVYRDRLDKDRGFSAGADGSPSVGIRTVATVPGDMLAAYTENMIHNHRVGELNRAASSAAVNHVLMSSGGNVDIL